MTDNWPLNSMRTVETSGLKSWMWMLRLWLCSHYGLFFKFWWFMFKWHVSSSSVNTVVALNCHTWANGSEIWATCTTSSSMWQSNCSFSPTSAHVLHMLHIFLLVWLEQKLLSKMSNKCDTSWCLHSSVSVVGPRLKEAQIWFGKIWFSFSTSLWKNKLGVSWWQKAKTWLSSAVMWT